MKKRKKRSVTVANRPPALSTVPVLQYLSDLVDCWPAEGVPGWRQAGNEMLQQRLQRAARRVFEGQREKREKVQHSLL